MVRLKKYMQQANEGKKQFNLHVPMSIWQYFENYCKSLNLKPTQAINILIEEELIEAGIIQKHGGKIIGLDEHKNEDQIIENNDQKENQKRKQIRKRTKKKEQLSKEETKE